MDIDPQTQSFYNIQQKSLSEFAPKYLSLWFRSVFSGVIYIAKYIIIVKFLVYIVINIVGNIAWSF